MWSTSTVDIRGMLGVWLSLKYSDLCTTQDPISCFKHISNQTELAIDKDQICKGNKWLSLYPMPQEGW